jgi:signal transduction histidine kinase
MRPVLNDLAGRIDPTPSPDAGISVRWKMLVVIPALTVAMAGGGFLFGAPPGVHHWSLVSGVLIAGAAATLLAVPVTLLTARSFLEPLDDILSATERLKRGDFKTPVPELFADEYGTVAHSFNEAMKGLADRQRLAGENEQLLDQVRASRARIVAASDAERRRVERNIHDGAQQRLVALALDLELLIEQTEAAAATDARSTAVRARETLNGALRELRELARGLHPSVLTTDGLSPALEQLALRATLPVEIHAPTERFPAAIEATVYFVACEALANTAKYAEASTARVSLERHNGRLVIEVSDDGIGGAQPQPGSGLAGLADRVAALDGSLIVESPSGHGTVLKAELPLTTHGV